jgi:rubrerythrin
MTELMVWNWAPLTRWQCLRCDYVFRTREAAPRCPRCNFLDNGS